MLKTENNFESADDFYEALLNAHQGLTTEQSHAMNARLVLLLANHIGLKEVLNEALRQAQCERNVLNRNVPNVDLEK